MNDTNDLLLTLIASVATMEEKLFNIIEGAGQKNYLYGRKAFNIIEEAEQ